MIRSKRGADGNRKIPDVHRPTYQSGHRADTTPAICAFRRYSHQFPHHPAWARLRLIHSARPHLRIEQPWDHAVADQACLDQTAGSPAQSRVLPRTLSGTDGAAAGHDADRSVGRNRFRTHSSRPYRQKSLLQTSALCPHTMRRKLPLSLLVPFFRFPGRGCLIRGRAGHRRPVRLVPISSLKGQCKPR